MQLNLETNFITKNKSHLLIGRIKSNFQKANEIFEGQFLETFKKRKRKFEGWKKEAEEDEEIFKSTILISKLDATPIFVGNNYTCENCFI